MGDDLEADWNAAVDARYIRSSDASNGARSSSDGPKRKRKQQSTDPSPDVENLPFLRLNSMTSDSQQPEDIDVPIKTWVDPGNQRVIAEFADGKKRALGALDHLVDVSHLL